MIIQDRLINYPHHPSMRGAFGFALYNHMVKNQDIVTITGDLGYPLFNPHQEDFKDRFYNVGAAEQFMMDFAVGLALGGKIPVVYSITPFLLFRPFETLRTYINHEKIPVILIGSGRDDDYKHDGFSHYAGDDHDFLSHLENINSYWPETTEAMEKVLQQALVSGKPTYINLKR